MFDHIRLRKDGQQCRVYFFKGWGTYSHPVKPLDPISYEEALQRPGFYRAWMCGPEENEKFVLFEGLELKTSEVPGVNLPEGKFFEMSNSDGTIYPGKELEPAETMGQEEFITTVVLGNTTRAPLLVAQRVAQKFEYEYAESGVLKRVVLTNDDGDVNVLDY